MMNNLKINALDEHISSLLHNAHSILIVSHIRPDGDAIGSLLGLGLTLEAAGKSVEMVLRDEVPEKFRSLPGVDRIQALPSMQHDVFIIVDSGDLERIGEDYILGNPDLQIDHHATNPHFGKLNLVLPDEAATCVILAEKLPVWGFPIPKPAAIDLISGILTDTIGFRTSSTNANALRQAARLMDIGADLPAAYFDMLVKVSYENARYWGAGLSSLQRHDSLIWAVVKPEDREWSGYNGLDDGDLTDILSSIQDADIAVLFNVHSLNLTKISWRSKPGFDVSTLAHSFGGGGHAAAAGAELEMSLDEAMPLILSATERRIIESKKENSYS